MEEKEDKIWKTQVKLSIAIILILLGGCFGLHIFNTLNGWLGIGIIFLSSAIAFAILYFGVYKKYLNK